MEINKRLIYVRTLLKKATHVIKNSGYATDSKAKNFMIKLLLMKDYIIYDEPNSKAKNFIIKLLYRKII